MTVLNIRALPQKDGVDIQSALKKTTVSISEAYGCDPQKVWATWDEIQTGFYIEGTESADKQPEQSHPPIGELICFEGKPAEVIEKVLLAAATTLSRELNIPGNIFITYREAKSGQVIAGNGVVRK